jgi:twitching motility protein PilT
MGPASGTSSRFRLDFLFVAEPLVDTMAQNPTQIGRPPVAPLQQRPLSPNAPRPQSGNGEGFVAYGREAVEAPAETPVEKISLDEIHLDELLQHVLDSKGSDLHMATDKSPCIRIHGKVKELKQYEHFKAPILQRIIYDVLTDEQIQRFENDLELDFAYTTADGAARFRVNAFRDKGALAAAMRVIPTKIPNPEDLGLPEVILELANRPRGLFLVTGPTGSGKSTTLAAVINKINSEHEGHIITIEDPIEFIHPHRKCVVNQREVGTDTRSFKNALRAAMREDPDVILVGEMRDTETIHLAVTAAETGHLVFGTLHTNSAAESIDRMVGVFPSDQQEQIRTQLSNSIVAVVTQQLLPKIGGGRVGAIEIMIANAAIRNLIREAKAHQMLSIMQTQTQIGMQTMDQALRDLVLNGLITYEDAISRSHNPSELEVMISGGTSNH